MLSKEAKYYLLSLCCGSYVSIGHYVLKQIIRIRSLLLYIKSSSVIALYCVRRRDIRHAIKTGVNMS